MDALSLLKLVSQLLVFFTGIWALFSDPKQDKPGKWKLTTRGWLQIISLTTGFAIFFISDMKQRDASEKENQEKTQTINTQNQQLRYLQHLILYQQYLSDLSAGWTLSAEETEAFEKHIARQPNLEDGIYLQTALKQGQVTLFPTADGWRLSYVLDRPQGTMQKSFTQNAPEFIAFKEAMAQALGLKFELKTLDGRTVFDFATTNWPTSFSSDKGTIKLTIDEPSLTLGELLNQQVKFICSDRNPPKKISLTCEHPKIGFHKNLVINWSPVVIRKWTNFDEQEFETVYNESQPFSFPLDSASLYARQ